MFPAIKNEFNKELPAKTPGTGVDFHMHTVASDGMWTPQTLVNTAVAQGLKTIAVSDHDTFRNVRTVQALAAPYGLQVVPGVEVTINWRSEIYHMLVLNFDLENPDFSTLLADTEAQSQAKKHNIIEGLKKKGYRLHKLDEVKQADGSFLTTDIVRALVRGGEVSTFDRGYNLCVPFGIEHTCSQPADRAIEAALSAGGIPMLAHPGRAEYSFSRATPEVLTELVGMGLAGVEVYHYSHQPADIELYQNFARRHNLLISAGSDSHNEARKPTPWNPELTRGLLERFALTDTGLDYSESAVS